MHSSFQSTTILKKSDQTPESLVYQSLGPNVFEQISQKQTSDKKGRLPGETSKKGAGPKRKVILGLSLIP